MRSHKAHALGFIAMYLLFCLLFTLSSLALSCAAGELLPHGTKESSVRAADTSLDNAVARPLMIDAGHGGEDGGAVGVNGVLEKELNLFVAEGTAGLALLLGIPYSMTRTEDAMLYDKYGELDSYGGKKKSLDLKNRLRTAEDADALVFLSIHMNKFTSPAYSGLQVYYSPNTEDGRILAESVQSYARAHLQRDNSRQAKPADSAIYLLHRLKMPAILVECGFLSSPSECALLSEQPYRASLACTVFVPVAEYFVRQ